MKNKSKTKIKGDWTNSIAGRTLAWHITNLSLILGTFRSDPSVKSQVLSLESHWVWHQKNRRKKKRRIRKLKRHIHVVKLIFRNILSFLIFRNKGKYKVFEQRENEQLM